MGRRRPYHPRDRAAKHRGILVQAAQRTIAVAEVNRDRALAGHARLEALIAEREALGLSTDSALDQLARSRIALASMEASLAEARRTLGLAA